MIPAQHLAGSGAAFAEGCAAKFTTPDHEGVVQQATLPEVLDQRGHRFVGCGHFIRESRGDAGAFTGAVEVPAPVEEIHKANAFFNEPPRQQAVVGKARLAGLRPVVFEHLLRLLGDVHDLGHAGLHAKGQLILRDARDSLGMAELGDLLLIEILQGIERLAAHGAVHAGGIAHKEHGIALAAALHALIHAGNEAAAPAALAAAGLRAAGDERDKARQVLILRAETIRGPRTHGGPALPRMPGEEQQLRRRMIELVRVHRTDHAHLIGDGVKVRAGVAHPDAAFAVLRKGTRCAHELGHPGGEGEAPAFENRVRAVLPAALHELRFVVKQVEVRRRSRHVQVDHAFGLRRKLRLLRRERIVRRCTGSRLLLQRMHGDGPKAELPRVAKELTARLELKGVVSDGVHVLKDTFKVRSSFCATGPNHVWRDKPRGSTGSPHGLHR